MSRLTIDISDQQHESLKARAAGEGKTIEQYAIDRLLCPDDDGAWQDFKAVIGNRIAAGLEGEVSVKNVETIVNEELGRKAAA